MEYDIQYIQTLETNLYIANRKLVELCTPYDVEINDREETINSLKQLKELLEGVEQPVNIKIKTKKLGVRK